jgi:hypothetical protein
MFIFNVSNAITLLLLLAATILLVFLAQEIKKSSVVAIALIFYLVLLVIHVFQLVTLSEALAYLSTTLSWCVVIDFIFIAITFVAFLWVDDIEAKALNKKSIDNSLDWFWKEL